MDQREVITRHHRAMEQYIRDINEKLPAFLEKHRYPYLQAFNAARTYGVFMNYVIEALDPKGRPTAPLIVYARMAEKLGGLDACLRDGFLESAIQVLRGMFEAEITLALLTESDSELVERSRLYTNYEQVGRWYNLKAHEELVSERIVTQDDFDARFPAPTISRITNDYVSVSSDYHPKEPGTFGWAWKIFSTGPKDRNPSLKRIAKHLGRLEQYNILYSTLSAVAHVGSVGRKALTNKEGAIASGFHFDDRSSQFVGMGIVYGHQALSHIRAYLPPPLSEELTLYSTFFLQESILKDWVQSPDDM